MIKGGERKNARGNISEAITTWCFFFLFGKRVRERVGEGWEGKRYLDQTHGGN